MNALGLANYWVAIVIMMVGFYGVIAKHNLVKKAISLGLFQTGVFLFYVSMGVVHPEDGSHAYPPIWETLANGTKSLGPFHNPLPHVLMLTAIVVSVSTLAVACALIINIQREYGTVEEDEILAADQREGGP